MADTPPLAVLATGTVAGATSGQVIALANPTPEAITSDTTGDPLAAPEVAVANIERDGSFTLYADPSTLPSADQLSDGTVNVDAVAIVNGEQQDFAFPVTPDSMPTSTSSGSFRAGIIVSPRHTPVIHFSMRGPTVRPVMPRTRKVAIAASTEQASATDAALVPDSVPNCEIIPGATVLDNPEHFMNVWTDGTASAQLAEGGGSTHTLGVEDLGTAGWIAGNGTSDISRSSSASVRSRARTQSWSYYNRVNYQEVTNTCTGGHRYPTGFYDILSADGGPTPWQGFVASCAPHLKGDVWNTGSATSTTYGAGVTIGPISLSAQSGFASSENITYTFLKTGELAGNNAAGPINSSKVEVDDMRCPL